MVITFLQAVCPGFIYSCLLDSFLFITVKAGESGETAQAPLALCLSFTSPFLFSWAKKVTRCPVSSANGKSCLRVVPANLGKISLLLLKSTFLLKLPAGQLGSTLKFLFPSFPWIFLSNLSPALCLYVSQLDCSHFPPGEKEGLIYTGG